MVGVKFWVGLFVGTLIGFGLGLMASEPDVAPASTHQGCP